MSEPEHISGPLRRQESLIRVNAAKAKLLEIIHADVVQNHSSTTQAEWMMALVEIQGWLARKTVAEEC